MVIRRTSLWRDRKFVALLLLVIGILLMGTVFYSSVEHLRWLNALYFSVITLTTVGYGDFAPQTDTGKIFTMFYLIIGIGILLAFISVISDHAITNYQLFREEIRAKTNSKPAAKPPRRRIAKK